LENNQSEVFRVVVYPNKRRLVKKSKKRTKILKRTLGLMIQGEGTDGNGQSDEAILLFHSKR